MLLQHLRKPVLAAALALLVLPGAALATDDNASPHAKYVPPVGRISGDVCAFLAMNIPGYNCGIPLAQYAGQPAQLEKPDGVDYRFWEDNVWEPQGDIAEPAGQPDEPAASQKPAGVDYKFWEENYWVFEDGRATFPEDAEPPQQANRPADRGVGLF